MSNVYKIITHPTNGFIRPFGIPTSIMSQSGIVSVNEGESISFTMFPATDGEIKDVIIDGSSIGTTGFYTFENVTSDHSIAVDFVY
jgi:hypothetical protein